MMQHDADVSNSVHVLHHLFQCNVVMRNLHKTKRKVQMTFIQGK